MYHIFTPSLPPSRFVPPKPYISFNVLYTPISLISLRRPSAKIGHIVEIVHLVAEPVHIPIITLIVLRLISLHQMREEIGVEVHGKIKRDVGPRRLHRVIRVGVAVEGLELIVRPRGGGIHGGSLAEVGEEAELVRRVLRGAVLLQCRWFGGTFKACGWLRFLVGIPLLFLNLEPHLDFLQYLHELGAKSVQVLIVQLGDGLEMNEEFLEIERDLDILELQHCSELCCTGADGKFDEDDNGVDKADVDERRGYPDLFDTIEFLGSV